jgi:hypothetical protein
MTLSIDDFRAPPALHIGSRGGLYMIRGGFSMAEMASANRPIGRLAGVCTRKLCILVWFCAAGENVGLAEEAARKQTARTDDRFH